MTEIISFDMAIMPLIIMIICAYAEYLLMTHYLPRCPKKELLYPMGLIYFLSPVVKLIACAIAFAIAFSLLLVTEATMANMINIAMILIAPLCLYVFIFATYELRKFVFKKQFENKNWQDLNITWKECRKAIWRSWLCSVLIAVSLSLITMPFTWKTTREYTMEYKNKTEHNQDGPTIHIHRPNRENLDRVMFWATKVLF